MSYDQTPPVPGPGASHEPLLTVGTITAATTAALVLLASFGLPIDNNKQAAILGVVAIVAPFVVAFVGRSRVWAPATVRALVARRGGDGTPPPPAGLV